MVREKILDILSDICGTDEIKRNPDLEYTQGGSAYPEGLRKFSQLG